MQKFWRAFSLWVLVTFLIVIWTPGTFSQVKIDRQSNFNITQDIIQAQVNPPQEQDITPKIPEQQTNSDNNQQSSKGQKFPVVLDGETLFYFSSVIQGLDAERRAKDTAQEIKQVAKNFTIPLDSLIIVELEGVRLISSEKDTIFALVEADAREANLSLDRLAEKYLQITKDAIAQYRENYSIEKQVIEIILATIEFIILVVLLILLRKMLHRTHRRIDEWRTSRLRPIGIQGWQLFSVDQEANLLFGLSKLIFWVITVVWIIIYLSFFTLYFPQTKKLGQAILDFFSASLATAGEAVSVYLPNLFFIILTIVVAHYIIRFCKLFFNAIDTGNLSLQGFDRDWAKPTQRLIVILIYAFTLAIIFPLLPGAKSRAFQGVSIFVGALFTLGGASAIANLVGGFIIIYTRAFRIGDHVQIGDVKGDILEKTILSTRIRTPKNKIVTIPNANLLTTNIENFTTAARDINQPIILHTTVTLGYDVSWRKIHQVLIDAALSSPSILEEPPPFVLQTSLGDFAVSYELNAYTNHPSMMPKIYSQLHQNIQDKCNAAGIEILSPQYSAVRDGNQNTIPEDYLPKDYQTPGFRVDLIRKLLNKPGDGINH